MMATIVKNIQVLVTLYFMVTVNTKHVVRRDVRQGKIRNEYDINFANGIVSDIVLDKEVKGRKRRGLLPPVVRWPKVGGELIIPYAFHESIPQNSQKRQRIEYFIGQINSFIKCNRNTWRPRTNQVHYVLFKDSNGCSSRFGRLLNGPQPQVLNLADDCVFENDGTVLHEMLHTMGFAHEHSRLDRDAFVNVDFSNIRPDTDVLFNFVKFGTNSLGSPYEIGSVMHYAPYFFAKDPSKPVITRKTASIEIMGQRFGMTAIDKDQMNAFYECIPKVTITKPPLGEPMATLPPKSMKTLQFCNWKGGDECKANGQFKLTQDADDIYLTAASKQPYYSHGRCRRNFLENYVTLKGVEDDVRSLSKCSCPHRYYHCQSTKFCLFVSYRRRADLSEKVGTPPSEMQVCLRNCRPGFNCLWYYQHIGCEILRDNKNERNRWNTAYFEFQGKCKGVRTSTFVRKGLDHFDIRQISLTVGDCPVSGSASHSQQMLKSQRFASLSNGFRLTS